MHYAKEKLDNSINNVAYYKAYKYSSIQRLHDQNKMHGVKRVVVFCIMTAVLPTALIITPLYLRHVAYANTVQLVAESDILKITEGMSSIFCQRHTLQMNTTFNAFQINKMPEISRKRKHIRLKKSMSLPDDTLEYWGFFLLKGATVKLKVCSRYQGSRILVVKGEKHLKTCGLLEHNLKKFGAHMDQDYRQVKVIYETNAQEIMDSKYHADGGRRVLMNKTTDYDENTGAEDLRDLKTESDGTQEPEEVLPTVTVPSSTPPSTEDRYNKSKPLSFINERSTGSVAAASAAVATGVTVGSQDAADFINETYYFRNDYLDQTATVPVENVNINVNNINSSESVETTTHKRRHVKRKFSELQTKLYKLHSELNSGEDIDLKVKTVRSKRSEFKKIYNDAIEHGGNAVNFTQALVHSDESSTSSFETGLLTCYDGQILLTRSFTPSHICNNVTYLEKMMGHSDGPSADHLETVHEIVTDGYYYYIFYSDNDIIVNEIHAVFNIYKPTFKYSNISSSKSCVNKTECSFDVSMFSDEAVFVEVLTRDGIEHDGDDITQLVSICEPRTSVYIIFPFAVLFLILGCAFL